MPTSSGAALWLAGVLSLAPSESAEPVEESAEAEKRHRYTGTLDLGFAQFRDELNQKLVFHGGQLGGRFGYRHDLRPFRLQWSVGALLGMYGSHGMPALSLRMDWLDLAFLFPIRRQVVTVWLGPGLDSDLRWYVNPLQQSGSYFWYGHYDLELRVSVDFEIDEQRFRAGIRAAGLSVVSRPDPLPDPYFYDWRFTDLVARTHRNMRVGSLESIRHMQGSFSWLVPRKKRDLGVGYTFRVESYAHAPSLSTVQHTVNLSWHQR